MDQTLQQKVTKAKRLKIPVGALVHQYAVAYLEGGFASFVESSSPPSGSSFDMLIKVAALNDKVEMSPTFSGGKWTYRLEIPVRVEDDQGRPLLEKTLKEAPMEVKASATGGLGMVQQSVALSTGFERAVHNSLERMFLGLKDEIEDRYKDWGLRAQRTPSSSKE